MKVVQKEKLAAFTVLSIIFSIAFGLILYFIVSGFTKPLDPRPNGALVNFLGTLLILLSLVIGVLSYRKRKLFIVKYSIISLALGIIMIGLKLLYFDISGGYGKITYYVLLGLCGLYATGVTVYAIYKFRKG